MTNRIDLLHHALEQARFGATIYLSDDDILNSWGLSRTKVVEVWPETVEEPKLEQRTPAWVQVRLGKVTASRVADIVARTKTGVSASRATYRAQLVCERLTGMPQDSFKSPAMEWGTLTEPDARAAYEFETGRKVETVGFVQHPGFIHAGASPDGLVGEDGLIEIKCPNTATHIETLLGKAVPGKYICQMQWQLACTGRQWCDFVSYDPRLPGHLQLGVYRLERDAAHIADLEAAVGSFLDEVQAVIDQLEGL